jgi:hypothetical protein
MRKPVADPWNAHVKATLTTAIALLPSESQSFFNAGNYLRNVAIIILSLNRKDPERPCRNDAKSRFSDAPEQILLNAGGCLADSRRSDKQHCTFTT